MLLPPIMWPTANTTLLHVRGLAFFVRLEHRNHRVRDSSRHPRGSAAWINYVFEALIRKYGSTFYI